MTEAYTEDDMERLRRTWGLDNKQSEALKLIRDGVPIKNFAEILGEELWLRELLKDLEANQCRHCKKFSSAARSKAIQLIGEWMGLIGNKSKKKSKKTVSFEE